MLRLGNSLNLAKTEGHQKLTQSFTIYPMQPNKTNVSFGPIVDNIGQQQIFSIAIQPIDTDCFDTNIQYTARLWNYSNDGRTFQARHFQVKDNLSEEFVYYDQKKQSKGVLIEREVDHNTGFVRFLFCNGSAKAIPDASPGFQIRGALLAAARAELVGITLFCRCSCLNWSAFRRRLPLQRR